MRYSNEKHSVQTTQQMWSKIGRTMLEQQQRRSMP
jgi:hypothetical protein